MRIIKQRVPGHRVPGDKVQYGQMVKQSKDIGELKTEDQAIKFISIAYVYLKRDDVKDKGNGED